MSEHETNRDYFSEGWEASRRFYLMLDPVSTAGRRAMPPRERVARDQFVKGWNGWILTRTSSEREVSSRTGGRR